MTENSWICKQQYDLWVCLESRIGVSTTLAIVFWLNGLTTKIWWTINTGFVQKGGISWYIHKMATWICDKPSTFWIPHFRQAHTKEPSWKINHLVGWFSNLFPLAGFAIATLNCRGIRSCCFNSLYIYIYVYMFYGFQIGLLINNRP